MGIVTSIIRRWRKEAGIKQTLYYNIDFDKRIITIFTHRPGILIGYHGKLVTKYQKELNEKFGKDWSFEFKECCYSVE